MIRARQTIVIDLTLYELGWCLQRKQPILVRHSVESHKELLRLLTGVIVNHDKDAGDRTRLWRLTGQRNQRFQRRIDHLLGQVTPLLRPVRTLGQR